MKQVSLFVTATVCPFLSASLSFFASLFLVFAVLCFYDVTTAAVCAPATCNYIDPMQAIQYRHSYTTSLTWATGRSQQRWADTACQWFYLVANLSVVLSLIWPRTGFKTAKCFNIHVQASIDLDFIPGPAPSVCVYVLL